MKLLEISDIFHRQNPLHPWHVDWEITKKCDNKCVHCYLQKMSVPQDVPIEIIKRTIKKLKAIGVFEIGYTGGEPFLYKGFDDVLQFTKDTGITSAIYTSGNNITKQRAKLIRESAVSRVEVTFLGANEQMHNRLTNNRNAYQQLLRSVCFLREQGVRVVAKMMVMHDNYAELDEFFVLCEKLDVECQHDCKIWKPYNGNEEDIQPLRLNQKEVCDYYCRFSQKIEPGSGFTGMCTAGKKKIAINAEGNVSPCGIYENSVIFGNINHEDIECILRESEVRKSYLKQVETNYPVKQCITCGAAKFCEVCPGMSAWGGVNLSQPYNAVCEDAKLRQRLFEKQQTSNQGTQDI